MKTIKSVAAWLIVAAMVVLLVIWLLPIMPNLIAFVVLSAHFIWAMNTVTAKWSS